MTAIPDEPELKEAFLEEAQESIADLVRGSWRIRHVVYGHATEPRLAVSSDRRFVTFALTAFSGAT